MNYICDREVFLKMKEHQKELTTVVKKNKAEKKRFFAERRTFYTNKGIRIPNLTYTYCHKDGYPQKISIDIQNGFNFIEAKNDFYFDGLSEPRYFNVLYGLIKGKKYNQIEQKTREGNKLDLYYLKYYATKWGIDYNILLKNI